MNSKTVKAWKTTGKIKDNIRTNNNNSYDANHMKIRLNSYDDLPLRKPLDLYDFITVIRSAFLIKNKYIYKFF